MLRCRQGCERSWCRKQQYDRGLPVCCNCLSASATCKQRLVSEQVLLSKERYGTLWRHPRVVSTPHIGPAREDAQMRSAKATIDRVYEYMHLDWMYWHLLLFSSPIEDRERSILTRVHKVIVPCSGKIFNAVVAFEYRVRPCDNTCLHLRLR